MDVHLTVLLACGEGHEPVVNLLLQHMAGVTARSRFQLTALHEACVEGYDGLAKLLLQHGMDADARDKGTLRMNSLRMDSLRANAPCRSEDIPNSTCMRVVLTCMIALANKFLWALELLFECPACK